MAAVLVRLGRIGSPSAVSAIPSGSRMSSSNRAIEPLGELHRRLRLADIAMHLTEVRFPPAADIKPDMAQVR
jgi:hypothetical protein